MSSLDCIIERIGNIVLKDVMHMSDDKKILSVELLIKSMIISVLDLSKSFNNNISFDKKQVDNLETFLNASTDAITQLCLLLDYDNDGKIELIRKDSKNNIVAGDDIEKLMNDTKGIQLAFKPQCGNASTSLLVIFSSLILYFSDEKFTHFKSEIESFKNACVKTHNSYILIKNTNNKIIDNSESIVKFIITMCVISFPVIDLVNKKIIEINNNPLNDLTDPSSNTITNDIINKSVHDMYGYDLGYIMKIVDSLANIILKSLVLNGTKNKIIEFFKKISCCVKSN